LGHDLLIDGHLAIGLNREEHKDVLMGNVYLCSSTQGKTDVKQVFAAKKHKERKKSNCSFCFLCALCVFCGETLLKQSIDRPSAVACDAVRPANGVPDLCGRVDAKCPVDRREQIADANRVAGDGHAIGIR